MQHAPLANAACCIFHTTARQYCGEASSPSKPSASCCLLFPSENSCQCLGSRVPTHSVMRASTFCRTGQHILSHKSVLSVAQASAFFCENQWRGRFGIPLWNDVGMGLWNLGLWTVGTRLAGPGKSTGALKKEAQQAGLTNLLRLLVRRDRDSNPGYSRPYAAFRVRSIRPLWHLSSSGCAALPVPCACRRWAGL